VASVVESAKAISAEGCQVVIITFGVEEGARLWKEDTGCPFPVYLDRSRALYQYLGMRRSLRQTLNQRTMIYYISKKLSPDFDQDKFNTNTYASIPDDHLQMGGDVIFTKTGIVEFSHLTTCPSGRVSVSKVLQLLKDPYIF